MPMIHAVGKLDEYFDKETVSTAATCRRNAFSTAELESDNRISDFWRGWIGSPAQTPGRVSSQTVDPVLGLPRVLEYSKNYSSNFLLPEYSLNSTSGCKFPLPVSTFVN